MKLSTALTTRRRYSGVAAFFFFFFYKTTNNSFSFILTACIHASDHSPAAKSSQTLQELQHVLPTLQYFQHTNKQMHSPHRASSSRCFHICMIPLNAALFKQKKLLTVAKLSRIARVMWD